MNRLEYRRSLGLPDLALDEKISCRRCGEDIECGCEPDGCRDPDCPFLSRPTQHECSKCEGIFIYEGAPNFCPYCRAPLSTAGGKGA